MLSAETSADHAMSIDFGMPAASSDTAAAVIGSLQLREAWVGADESMP